MKFRIAVTTVLSVISIVTLARCATWYSGVYRMKVVNVERQERRSTNSTSLAVDGNTATDGRIEMKWNVTNREMSLTIRNLTDEVVKIIWDEATFLGADGTSLRLVHRGVQSPADVEFSHLPSVLPRGGKIDDSVFPADLIHHSEEKGWVRSPLVPEARAKSPQEAMRLGNEKRGQSIRVFLLIEVDGRLFEYVSLFAVDGVTVWELDSDGDEPLAVQPRS